MKVDRENCEERYAIEFLVVIYPLILISYEFEANPDGEKILFHQGETN